MQDRLEDVRAQVQAALDDAMAGLPDGDLTDAMRYACIGGKRIRAFLVMESARLFGLRDREALGMALRTADPEVVFHLAAQPLVRESYRTPVETWATNVQGTVHLLDACRDLPSLRAVLCVTSDKCYENNEWPWPYRENDAMGGHDPYSSSKGAAELAISAWRRIASGPADQSA